MFAKLIISVKENSVAFSLQADYTDWGVPLIGKI
jgi:hypothetical protein